MASTWVSTNIRGVLGRVRTALIEFVAQLRADVGDSDQLPSAEQAADAFHTAVPWIFNNSNVTINSTRNGDIMPHGTIKGNKTKIADSTGNFAVAALHMAQVSAEGIDVEKIREFADLVTQIGPTLELAEDQQAELQSGATELQVAVSAPTPEKGRIRRALDRVMIGLRGAGSTAARGIAIGVGDELMREIGGEIIKDLLPH